MSSLTKCASIILSLGLALIVTTTVLADPKVALKGYDPVAYFTDGKPVKGDKAHSYDWDEARYLFANAKNKAAFASAPEKYAPQFGGLCATGLAFGKTVEADPQAWKIVDGKLYLFSSIKAKEAADKDPAVLVRAHTATPAKKN
jgi:YHS domain-containing protein